MERLLFEAQTVQNLSLYESAGSSAEAISGAGAEAGAGGGGGGWGVEVPEFVRRGSYAILKTM